MKLTVPDTAGRDHSVTILDAYTNNVAVLGQRVTGTLASEFVLVGPRWTGPLPEGSRVVRATTDDVLVLGRILVSGPADLPAVHTLH